jgi:hypothetical protein
MSFSFDDLACGGNTCADGNCDGNAAFSDATNGGPSLRQCNDANVGMQYVLFVPLDGVPADLSFFQRLVLLDCPMSGQCDVVACPLVVS